MVVRACSPSYLGGWDGRITSAQEFEVAVNYDHTTALQPGQQEQNSVYKKKKSDLSQLPIFLFQEEVSEPIPTWAFDNAH